MRSPWFRLFLLSCLLSPACPAAELEVVLSDNHQSPVAEAVVSLTPAAGIAVRRAAPQTKVIDQRNETFVPYVEYFHRGDSVVFHNDDDIQHHVYSFSPIKSFEFILSPGKRGDSMMLDQTGTVAVGCNIHDRMITYLYVSDAPYMAKTDVTGKVVFADLEPGPYKMRIWHPRFRPSSPDIEQDVTLADPADRRSLAFAAALVPDLRFVGDPERSRY